MPQQNISIKLGNKSVQLTVDSSQEAYFRQAGEQLQVSIRSYMKQYKIQDVELLLKYAAVSLLAEKLYSEQHLHHKLEQLKRTLGGLEEKADQILEV